MNVANTYKCTFLKKYAVAKDRGPIPKLQRIHQFVLFHQFTDCIRRFSLFPILLTADKRLSVSNELPNAIVHMMAGTKDDKSEAFVVQMIKETKMYDGVAPIFNKTQMFLGGSVAGMRILGLTFAHDLQRNVFYTPTNIEQFLKSGVYAGCSEGYSTFDKKETLNNIYFRQRTKQNKLWKLESPGETNPKLNNLSQFMPITTNKFITGPEGFASLLFQVQLPKPLQTVEDRRLTGKYDQCRNTVEKVTDERLQVGSLGVRPVLTKDGTYAIPTTTPKKRKSSGSTNSPRAAKSKRKGKSPSKDEAMQQTPQKTAGSAATTDNLLLAMYDQMKDANMLDKLAQQVNMELEEIEEVVQAVREGTPEKADKMEVDDIDDDDDDDDYDNDSSYYDEDLSVDSNEDELDSVLAMIREGKCTAFP